MKNPINRANIYYCVVKKSEYDSKYDISSLSAPSVQICLLLLQKDLGSLTY